MKIVSSLFITILCVSMPIASSISTMLPSSFGQVPQDFVSMLIHFKADEERWYGTPENKKIGVIHFCGCGKAIVPGFYYSHALDCRTWCDTLFITSIATRGIQVPGTICPTQLHIL